MLFRSVLAYAVAGALLLGALDARGQEAESSESSEDSYELLKLFVDTFHEVERNYVTSVSRRELMEAAIEGMLSKLDQHSDYIAPQELAEFKRGVESEFAGIGVQVAIEKEELTIISPIVDSPAYAAGLVAGDVITHIEDEPVRGLPLQECVRRMKGKLGTSLKLTVRRAETNASETMSVVRDNVRIRTVRGDRRKEDDSWDFLCDHEHKIAYIRLTAFSRHTVAELREALDSLADQELQGLILDVRSNPGGLLSAAIEVCDLFVTEGLIVSASGRNVETREWPAHRAGTFTDFPIAVLVNRFSASASEIVAACLQDHGRAVIVGQRTWGKGSVQNIVELEGGGSALKLTTAEYRRPGGGNIHRHPQASEDDEWGIKPDHGLELKLSDAEAAHLDRIRRSRDLLRRGETETEVIEDRQFKLALNYLVQKVMSARGQQPPAEVATSSSPVAAPEAAER